MIVGVTVPTTPEAGAVYTTVVFVMLESVPWPLSTQVTPWSFGSLPTVAVSVRLAPCWSWVVSVELCTATPEEVPTAGVPTARELPLRAEPVAAFYDRVTGALSELDIAVEINTKPQEVADTTPFEKDQRPREYDRDAVTRCWRILASTADVLEEFRGRFVGKASPVHFFWGSFDLAHTRFSGRKAPPRKGVITGPGYSHEVISFGFWPGGSGIDGPAFYSYSAPAPEGLSAERIGPPPASWDTKLGEWILMYDEVRKAKQPRAALMEFFQTAYEAGARRAGWDRASLDVSSESR